MKVFDAARAACSSRGVLVVWASGQGQAKELAWSFGAASCFISKSVMLSGGARAQALAIGTPGPRHHLDKVVKALVVVVEGRGGMEVVGE
jgi:hypothetical protein